MTSSGYIKPQLNSDQLIVASYLNTFLPVKVNTVKSTPNTCHKEGFTRVQISWY